MWVYELNEIKECGVYTHIFYWLLVIVVVVMKLYQLLALINFISDLSLSLFHFSSLTAFTTILYGGDLELSADAIKSMRSRNVFHKISFSILFQKLNYKEQHGIWNGPIKKKLNNFRVKTIEKCVQYEYAARYDVTINIAQHFNSIFIWKKISKNC